MADTDHTPPPDADWAGANVRRCRCGAPIYLYHGDYWCSALYPPENFGLEIASV